MSAKTAAPPRVLRPDDLRPDPRLGWHRGSRKWRRRIDGKDFYFGTAGCKYADAVDDYYEQVGVADDIEARPDRTRATCSVAGVFKDLLDVQIAECEGERISPTTLAKYRELNRTLRGMIGAERKVSDLGPRDFRQLLAKIEKRWPGRAPDAVGYVRRAFRKAYRNGLSDREPERLIGDDFRAISPKQRRKRARRTGADRVRKDFTIPEACAIIAVAEQTSREAYAMVLLAINAGFYPSDIADLGLDDIEGPDEDGRYWYRRSRVKTAEDRCFAFWPETAAAIHAYIEHDRPKPKRGTYGYRDIAGHVFLTPTGDVHERVSPTTGRTSASVGKVLGPVQRAAKAGDEDSDRLAVAVVKGRGICKGLRHTFRTISRSCTNAPEGAARIVMGQSLEGIDAEYGTAAEGVQAITDHVRSRVIEATTLRLAV